MIRAAEAGKDVPSLDNRPDLPPDLIPAWECVCDLGIAPSWRDTREWAAQYGVDFDWLWEVIRTAAGELRTWQAKRATSGSPPSQAGR